MGEKTESKNSDKKPEISKNNAELKTGENSLEQNLTETKVECENEILEEDGENEDEDEQNSEDDNYEEELEEKEEEEEEKEKEIEEEEEKNVKEVTKRRCQRRKKFKVVCVEYYEEEEQDEEKEEKEDEEEEEEGNEDEDEDEDSEKSYDFSTGTSIFSALTFQWEEKTYEFEELCDPGDTIKNIYKRYGSIQRIVDDGGKSHYIHLCRILFVAPIIRLLSAFNTSEIDLSYRGIDSKNMRAMCAALRTNNSVTKLILKYNKLNEHDCHHLGYALGVNEKISLLDLTGCRIGPIGVKLLVENLTSNDYLTELNLSKCNIQDEGMKYLSRVLLRNNSIQKLDLSYNNLKTEAADFIATAMKINEAIENLNLCYNFFFDPVAVRAIFRSLGGNKIVKILNISWNALSGADVGIIISNFLKRSTSIVNLDLSNNRLDGAAIAEIKKGLSRSKTLETLKLGRNPISSPHLDVLLPGVQACATLSTLDLEDLWVDKSFMKMINKIKSERNLQLIIGGIHENYEIPIQDFQAILFKRANFEAMKPKSKKRRKDFGHLIWTLGDNMLTPENFMIKVKKFKAKVAKELILQIMQEFTHPKNKMIDVVAMRNKYISLFPDSTPPPVKVKGKIKGVKRLDDKMIGVITYDDAIEEGGSEQGELELELLVEKEKEKEPVNGKSSKKLIIKSREELKRPERTTE